MIPIYKVGKTAVEYSMQSSAPQLCLLLKIDPQISSIYPNIYIYIYHYYYSYYYYVYVDSYYYLLLYNIYI